MFVTSRVTRDGTSEVYLSPNIKDKDFVSLVGTIAKIADREWKAVNLFIPSLPGLRQVSFNWTSLVSVAGFRGCAFGVNVCPLKFFGHSVFDQYTRESKGALVTRPANHTIEIAASLTDSQGNILFSQTDAPSLYPGRFKYFNSVIEDGDAFFDSLEKVVRRVFPQLPLDAPISFFEQTMLSGWHRGSEAGKAKILFLIGLRLPDNWSLSCADPDTNTVRLRVDNQPSENESNSSEIATAFYYQANPELLPAVINFRDILAMSQEERSQYFIDFSWVLKSAEYARSGASLSSMRLYKHAKTPAWFWQQNSVLRAAVAAATATSGSVHSVQSSFCSSPPHSNSPAQNG